MLCSTPMLGLLVLSLAERLLSPAAQNNKSVSELDLLVFVSSVGSSTSWISAKFPQPIPYLGGVCQQSISSVNSPSVVVGAVRNPSDYFR